MACVTRCNDCTSARTEDETLRTSDHVDSQDAAPSNVFVESDGPESDKPETTASMGSMLEQSLEGWRLIGQAMRSLLSCSCLEYPGRPRTALNQLRATANSK